MKAWAHTKNGFTIVELLIVIVVIAILAAITIVAYTGIQDRAKRSAIQSGLTQGVRALESAKVLDAASEYPATLPASLASGGYYYSKLSGQAFCLSQTTNGLSYFVTSSQSTAVSGSCEGLVGLWLMNGSTADTSGYSQDGTATNITSVAGQGSSANTASSFNGTSSQILMTNSSVASPLKPALPLSISTWVNINSLAAINTVFQNDQSQCGGTNLYAGMKLYVNTNGTVGFRLGNGGGCGGASRYDKTTTASLSTNQWYHVVVTADAARVYSIYIDGVEVSGAYAGTASTLVYTATPSRIGSSSDNTDRFSGSIDDVRVYSRVLPASEVQALYRAGAQ